MGTVNKIEIFWDKQDSNNEGWTLRETYDDGHQESEPYDLDTNASLADYVVEAAWQKGIEITADSVIVENQDGGFAMWSL